MTVMPRGLPVLIRNGGGVSAGDSSSGLESRFQACFEANYVSLRRYISRLSGEPAEADDLAQESFVRLWKELEMGSEVINPRAWLYRVAGNLVINRFKSRSLVERLRSEVDEQRRSKETSPGSLDLMLARRQVIERVLDRLPEPMRQCLLLYHEGLSGKEIAKVLDVKLTYVGTLVLRAHERFRREREAMGEGYDLHG